MTITQTIKNASVNGVINIDKALKIAEALDQEREQTTNLLRKCEKNVGMHLGEEINVHLANMNGTKFSTVDYHYESMPGEQ
jgi:hypothetical protein